MFWNKKGSLKSELAALQSELAQIKNDISLTDSQAFSEMFLGVDGPLRSVSANNAMTCSAVFSCVRLISGAVASAPVHIYKRSEKGQREQVWDHPYRKMLGLLPNDNITASTFWKSMAQQKVLHGNAYAAIVRGSGGRAIGLVPLRHNMVTPYQAYELGLDTKLKVNPSRLYYDVIWDNGKRSVMDQDDMVHVPNISWDGKQGLSTISAGAQSMGLALAAEESASKLFDNGLMSQVALSYPNKMGKDAQELLREHIAQRHAGASNHHKPLILTEGGDVKTMSMSAGDAQLIESRQFSVVDVCRFFGVPPVMVGETSKTSSWGSGVEQMARWFVMFTLNDHLTDIEQELERKLFSNSHHFCKFDESELTRGDTKTRADYNKAAIGSAQQPGWMTPNEIRLTENMPPIVGGEKLFIPASGEETSDVEKQIDATVQK